MNYIYCDASIDHNHKLGTYCIVVVEAGKQPRWFVEDCDGLSSVLTETRALLRAVREAQDLYARTGRMSTIMSDCVAAIESVGKTLSQTPYVTLRHIKAHQIESRSKPLGVMTNDIRKQNWADKEAKRILRKRIDNLNTSVHTEEVS